MTTEEIRAELAAGTAVLRYVKDSQAWYDKAAGAPRPDWIIETFSVGVDSPDGGTFGEWKIEVADFGWQSHVQGPQPHRWAARHCIYQDGWAAVHAIPGYLAMMTRTLTDYSVEGVEAALQSLGFTDATPRVSPYV